MSAPGHNRLAELADVIAVEHRQAEKAARKALDHALAAGDALLEAKGCVAHGEWAHWLSQHVPAISGRTAQLYMKLARHRDELNPQRVADLSLRQAERLVRRRVAATRAPGTTDATRSEVEEEVEELKRLYLELDVEQRRAVLDQVQTERAAEEAARIIVQSVPPSLCAYIVEQLVIIGDCDLVADKLNHIRRGGGA